MHPQRIITSLCSSGSYHITHATLICKNRWCATVSTNRTDLNILNVTMSLIGMSEISTI